MAVAYDAVGGNTPANSVNTVVSSASWTHTPVGTPAMVLVFVELGQDGGDTTAAIAALTASYGGVSMTALASPPTVTSTSARVKGFKLTSSIPAGAQTVALAWSPGLNHNVCIGHSVTLTGTSLDVRTLAAANNFKNDNATSLASTITSATGEVCVMFLAHGASFGASATLTASGTQRRLNNVDSATAGNNGVTATWAGAATVSVGVTTSSGSDSFMGIAVSVQETGGGATVAQQVPRRRPALTYR